MSNLSHSAELEEIERILESRVFQGSETLCRLLQFLAHKTLEEPGIVLKEYRIATEILGRKEDFDPRLDSSVRVQATRLRSKLIEYSVTEGINDPILVEMPKGAYRLLFKKAGTKGSAAAVAPVEAAEESPAQEPGAAQPIINPIKERKIWALAFATGLLAVLIGIVATIGFQHWESAKATNTAVDPALRSFWQPFLTERADRVVVFSNANFTGHPDRGMRYYHPGEDDPKDLIDHYTGVGEVLSVHELDRVFDALGYPVQVRRGALLAMDDVKVSNLIFLGSPVENLVLNDMPSSRFFRFAVKKDDPRHGEVGVANLHPLSGEEGFYLHAPNRPIVDDYAILARFRGLEQQRTILIAAGTTTIGTQGAVEFLCRPESVRQLLDHMGPGHAGDGFEAVLHVKVTKGVPVASEIVAFRRL